MWQTIPGVESLRGTWQALFSLLVRYALCMFALLLLPRGLWWHVGDGQEVLSLFSGSVAGPSSALSYAMRLYLSLSCGTFGYFHSYHEMVWMGIHKASRDSQIYSDPVPGELNWEMVSGLTSPAPHHTPQLARQMVLQSQGAAPLLVSSRQTSGDSL